MAVKFDLRARPAYSPEMPVKKRKEAAGSHNPLAQRILGQRAGADAEISLERLEAELIGASRYDIVASLKELEKAGEGQFRLPDGQHHAEEGERFRHAHHTCK